jgi:rod shape-determining protein MreD
MAIVLVGSVLTQEAVMRELAVYGMTVSLVLLLVVDWSIIRGTTEGMVFGLMAGALIDLFTGLPFGTSCLAFVLVAAVPEFLDRFLARRDLLVPVLSAIGATAIYFTVAIATVASTEHLIVFAPLKIAIVMALNAVVSPIIFSSVVRIDRMLNPLTAARV